MGRELLRMGRRRFVESLTSLGISGRIASVLENDDVVGMDLDEEVPRVKAIIHKNHEQMKKGQSPSREKLVYSIPRDTWEYRESHAQGALQLQQKWELPGISFAVSSTAGVNSDLAVAGVYRIKKSRDGRILHKPDLSYEEFKSQLPETLNVTIGEGDEKSTVENIHLVPERREMFETYEYDCKYRPVPGGCKIKQDSTDGGICTPAYDNDIDEYVWLTAGHLAAKGEDIGQPNYVTGDLIGHIDKRAYTPDSGADQDCATIRPYLNGEDHVYRIAGTCAGGSSYAQDIIGRLTNDALMDMCDSGETIHKQCPTTGRDSGQITYVDPKGSGTEAIWTNIHCEKGDSGGTFYDLEYNIRTNEEVAIIAAVQDWINKDSEGGGNTAGHMERKLNAEI